MAFELLEPVINTGPDGRYAQPTKYGEISTSFFL